MTAPCRTLSALLLAILLPVQSWATASMQICPGDGGDEHVAHVAAVGHDEPSQSVPGTHDQGSKTDIGPGKCCQSHVFVVAVPLTPKVSAPPTFEHTWYVARWTNFIPDEPSPPPISPLE